MKLNRAIIGILLSLTLANSIDIFPQVSGKITYLKKVGDSVKKGEKIIILDDKQIKAKLRKVKAKLQYFQIILNDKKLIESQNQELYDSTVLAKRDLDDIKLQTALAQAQYDEQKAKVDYIQLEVQKYTIVSPINGKIVTIPHKRDVTNIYQPQILMTIKKR